MQAKPLKPASLIHDMVPAMACALLMVQAYLVAPLSQTLAIDLGSPLVNYAVPAFVIPFALAAAATAFIKREDNVGKYFQISLAVLCLGTGLLGMADSVGVFLSIRVMMGLGTGFMLPSALLMAISSGNKRRSIGRAVPIIFALSIGMTFGPSLGGWLNGIIGWPLIYRLIGMLAGLLFFINVSWKGQYASPVGDHVGVRAKATSSSIRGNGYLYGFVYLTGVFHSGVFVWVSHYFSVRYRLDEFQIATDLFIFGLPGFLVTMLMYRFRLDKNVVNILYPALGITIGSLLALMGDLPLWAAVSLLAVMSVGFGCSQPLFIGLLRLPPVGGSVMGLVARGSGILFAGYGSGPLIMTVLLGNGLTMAILYLIILALILAHFARRVWKETLTKAVRLGGQAH